MHLVQRTYPAQHAQARAHAERPAQLPVFPQQLAQDFPHFVFIVVTVHLMQGQVGSIPVQIVLKPEHGQVVRRNEHVACAEQHRTALGQLAGQQFGAVRPAASSSLCTQAMIRARTASLTPFFPYSARCTVPVDTPASCAISLMVTR